MEEKMMAAVLHASGDLRYEEVPTPKIEARDILLKVKAAGNCGSDLERIMVKGTYSFPCIPGHETSGKVAKVGKDVKNVKEGDRVTVYPLIPCRKCGWCLQGQYNLCEDYDYIGSRSDGAFAEYVKVPAANAIMLPDNVDFEDGSMTDPAAVALHAINRAGGIKAGNTVVVLGAGPIGMLTCQWAKIFGAQKVIVTDIVEEKLNIMRKLGVDRAIDAGKEDVVEIIMSETGGWGADMIIEVAGSVETHKQSLLSARKRGKVVHIGRAHRDILLPDEVFTKIFRHELNIYGAVNSNISPNDHEWKNALHYISNGRLKPKPLITHRLQLGEIAGTFKKMYNKEIVYNKIIFAP
ncbi:MAG: galactitol-1-phosphate 5-dehydrogenase [Spirochaetota bacterium]|nr:MAG: galactitol-1-phosphate 5-dehydrogenase [Spirochaetota bacterium]